MLEIAFTILSFIATLALITVLLERRDLVNAVITFSLGALLFGIPIFVSMGVAYTLLIMTLGGMLIAYATNTVINRVKARAFAPLNEAQRRVREAREKKRNDGPVIEGFRAAAKAARTAARGVQFVGRAAGIKPRSESLAAAAAAQWTGHPNDFDETEDFDWEPAAPLSAAERAAAQTVGEGSSMALARTLLKRDAATRKRRVESVNAAVQAMPPSERNRDHPFTLPGPDPLDALLPGNHRPRPADPPLQPKTGTKTGPKNGTERTGTGTETIVKRFSRRPGSGGGVDGDTIQTFTGLSRKADATGRYRPHLSRLAARKRP